MKIKIKLLDSKATFPTKGTEDSAGYDLYTTSRAMLWPSDTKMLKTGIAMEIPKGYFGAIYPRSGLSTKQGVRLANCVAVIDSDYRGEICVPLHNDSTVKREIKEGERVAQIVIQKYEDVGFEQVEELSDTERGSGGFGSTGE